MTCSKCSKKKCSCKSTGINILVRDQEPTFYGQLKAGDYLVFTSSDGSTGVILRENTKAKLTNVYGNNNLYGVRLLTGSSFYNAGDNTISGSSDVLVGESGAQSWVNINTKSVTYTTDTGTATPQYVFISG